MEHGHHSGMWVPGEPPTWARMFIPHLDPWSVLPVLALVAGVAYLVGALRLRRQGVRWPWWRAASFVVGVLSLFAVTGTWLNGYSMELFSVHMAQHMVLSLITPLFLLVGSPVTLALRALPARCCWRRCTVASRASSATRCSPCRCSSRASTASTSRRCSTP